MTLGSDMPNLGAYNIGGQMQEMTMANVKVRITHLSLYSARSDYQAPWQRTFDINASVSTVNKFQNIIANRGKGTELPPHAVATIVPELVNIQYKPTGQANIPNGWREKRFRFIMVVESDTMEGTKRFAYIQGFTEYPGVTTSGIIDPNMVFYVNSVTNVTQTFDRVNNKIYTVPSNTFNVVTDMFGYGRYQEVTGYDLPKLARPKDIVENAMSLTTTNNANGRIINLSGTLGEHSADTSSRVNGDPSQYLSKLYNSFTEGKLLSAYTADEVNVLQNTADSYKIMEIPLLSQPFFKAIQKVTGEVAPSSFTLNVLLAIDPNIPNLPPQVFFRDEQGINLGPQNIPDYMEDSNTADTLNPTAENLKSVTICNSINSFMLENLITQYYSFN